MSFFLRFNFPFLILQTINIIICFCFFFEDINLFYYSISLFSSFSTISLFFSIKNNLLRKIFLLIFFFVELTTVFAKLKFGQICSNMILATIGTDFSIVFSTIKLYGAFNVCMFLSIYFLIFFLVFCANQTRLINTEKIIHIISMLFVIISPILSSINDWGYRFALNNIKYSPSFLGDYYLYQSRIFWGPVFSLFLIIVENVIDSSKYLPILHNNSHVSLLSSKQNTEGVNNIIYVIGESSNPKYYSIYNKQMQTTKNIEHLQQKKFLHVFKKVHSPASQTRVAVPMLLSFSSPLEKDQLFKVKNVVELAHEAGYCTYWIDSQNGFTLWNKTFGFLAQYAQNRATPDKNNNSHFNIQLSKDDTLFPAIEYYFKNRNKKNLFIIHLYGNHMPYNTNVDEDDINTLKNAETYEKSIHHVDKLLFKIIECADKYIKQYEFIYIADHGEIKNIGHGFHSNNNEFYLIPCVMKNTKYCKILESYRRNDGWISGAMMKYIVLQMMGYSFNTDIINNHIDHSNLVLDEREIVIDFNTLQDCSEPTQ